MPKKRVEIDDDSIMPFGKHKGKRMIDVPTDWLIWWYNETKPMVDYIEAAIDGKELGNG